MNRYTETNVWNDPRSYAPDLYDALAIVEHYEKLARQAKWRGRFGFANRAADASHSSLLRVSTIGGIAIAVLCVLYFAWQFAGRPGL